MKNILIVDDVKSWREFHSNILYSILGEDIEITKADSAGAAYDILLQQKPFDYIITDLQMETDYSPKHAGEWLVEQIKTFKLYNDTKIVMISASYNIRQIAEGYGVYCIPKSTALKCISTYEEIFKQ